MTELQAWLDGERTAEAIWQWALAQPRGQFEDGLVQDVVDILVDLPHDLILEEDAEVMLYGLNNPPDEADLAQNLLWNHMDGIDSNARRTSLADHPFYGPFCNPEG
ncbi:MAG: hypothetical protein AAF529_12340 [Pseudomonadota bacterium]